MKKTLKRVVSLLLAIILLSCTFCLTSSAQTTNVLEEHRRYSGYLNAGEYFWCSFTPDESNRYFIESIGNDDTYIIVYSDDGYMITSNDDSGDGKNFRLAKYLSSGNTYYFEIGFYDTAKSGELTFDFHGKLTQALSKTIYPVDLAADYRYWNFFTPTVTTLYSFECTNSQHAVFTLYDSEFNEIARDENSGYYDSFKVTAPLTANTTYYFSVALSDNSTSSRVEYTINDASFVMTKNETVTCSLDPRQSAWLTFVPDRTTYYTFGSYESGGTFASLYNVNGRKITTEPSSVEGDFMLSYLLTAGKTYYYEVRFDSAQASGDILVFMYEEYYPDVNPKGWYYEAVEYVSYFNFMTGYQNGNFGPADILQRQDFVVALARIAGADLTAYQDATGNLSDVATGSYYAPSVAWAVDNGIITGYQDGRFGVGDTITREQVCTIFYRYMNSPAVENVDSTLSVFPDKAHVSRFAKTAMAWAIDNGIVSGMQNGRLAPTAGASRAQIATIIMRMDQSGMFA